MKIAAWNVNSIKQRTPHVKRWLERADTDVLMIQELKGEAFPTQDFSDMGYESVNVAQKAYNGVAILSKSPIKTIMTALPGEENDDQARYLEAEVNGMRVLAIYAPNGNPVDSDKFAYKLRWLSRLSKRVKELREKEIPFLIGGDFNVIPEDRDCYDPNAWTGDALFRPESRAAFRTLLHQGLTDAFRVHNAASGHYTYWDYQGGAWPAGKGIRIDHFLLSPTVADKMRSCEIDPTPRGEDQPSDHTPIIVELDGK